MTTAEMFARVWHVGLALTPLLVGMVLLVRLYRDPVRRHAVAVAVLAGLAVSAVVPVAADPGSWLTAARRDFRASGLAPCLPVQPVAVEPQCIAYRWRSPWLVGVFVLLGWQGLGWFTVRALRRRARPASSSIRAEVRAAAEIVGVPPPTVAVHDRMTSPMVTGWRRPALLLPAGLWASLDARAREAILLHELAHVRRRDLVTLPLTALVCAVFWWHPVVWWVRSHARRAAELASDLSAVRARPDRAHALARALIEVERYATERVTTAAAAPALSPNARDLAVRLRQLVGPDAARPGRPGRWWPAMAFALALGSGSSVIQVVLM